MSINFLRGALHSGDLNRILSLQRDHEKLLVNNPRLFGFE
jgi:hypothetical protein